MSRRKLDPEERSIWKHVTRSVKPLAVRPLASADEFETEPPPPRRGVAKPKPIEPLPAPRLSASAPAAPLGRKEKRRLGRDGAIHARLDLHGMTQAQAHDALFHFLQHSQLNGAKVVLVITGKGGVRGDGERGVLRRQVPHWLHLPAFRAMIVGFEAAAIGHGGDGAMYVRLRRMRS